jgi:ABC-type lipoprotein release transport system permease subunit
MYQMIGIPMLERMLLILDIAKNIMIIVLVIIILVITPIGWNSLKLLF